MLNQLRILGLSFICEVEERFNCIKYTLKHYVVVNKLAFKHGYLFPLHDLDKVILYPILGKRMTHNIHRRWSSHHYRNGDIKNKAEAVFDWESARYTKPDKPLDAYDTWVKYYHDVDMAYWLEKFGYFHYGI